MSVKLTVSHYQFSDKLVDLYLFCAMRFASVFFLPLCLAALPRVTPLTTRASHLGFSGDCSTGSHLPIYVKHIAANFGQCKSCCGSHVYTVIAVAIFLFVS